MARREGQFIVEDFFVNTGGLNTNDSPFVVQTSQATDGQNYDYIRRGGFQKRPGHSKINSSANTQLKSLGLSMWNTPTASRVVVRAAGTKIQSFDPNTAAFANLTEDTTAAGSDFLNNSSTQPVISSMFNTTSAGQLWLAGGGMSSLYGVYSGTKVTANGVPMPATSSFTAAGSGAGSNITLAAGKYRYTLAFRKSSTQASSNGDTAVEASVTVVATQDFVQLNWTITNNDTTKYDKILIYRSSTNGAAGFTTGDLVAMVNSNVTSYQDNGSFLSTAVTIPRLNNVLNDKSTLPSGTYTTAVLFKRRLVTAKNGTLYFSDLNLPESWPSFQQITIPSGGAITGLAIVGLTSPLSTDIDEALVVFKQSEAWVVTGDGTIDSSTNLPNWSLKFLDNSGAPNQACIVSANGYIAWLAYRGVFMWNGSGKPLRISRTIKDKFQQNGDIDKSKLNISFGMFSQKRNEIEWVLSSKTYGEQQYVLKLDLDLTQANVTGDALNNNQDADGVFTPDTLSFPVYAGFAGFTDPAAVEESILLGDASGFIYSGYIGTADGSNNIPFSYTTPFLNMGSPNMTKQFMKVVVWVLDNGAYNIGLNYWTDYRFLSTDASASALQVSANYQSTGLVWDVGKWDQTTWDSNSNKPKPLIFNLSATALNNNQGAALLLQFTENSNLQTPVIYGFSVYYSEVAPRI